MTVAYRNDTLKEHICIDPLAGYPPVTKGLDLKLIKSLYWLEGAPREWDETLDTFLREELNTTRLKTEQFIHIRFNESD